MIADRARADELHAIGIRLRDAGEWQKALEAFEATRAIEVLLPEAPERSWSLGMTLHEIAWLKAMLGELTEARELYELALEAKLRVPPDNREWNEFSTTLHELGYIQNQLGMSELALATFESSIAANKMIEGALMRRAADAATFRAIAHIHLDARAWRKAVHALSAELASLDDPGLSARELYWRAYCLVELEDWEAAEVSALASHRLYEDIPHSLKDRDGHADVLFELAHLARHRGDRNQAATWFRAARQMLRQHATAQQAR